MSFFTPIRHAHFAENVRNRANWMFETERFLIGLFADPEETDPNDQFEHSEDVDFALEDTDGHWFCAVVRVFLKSGDEQGLLELGSAVLGGCSYNSVEEFYTSHRDPDPANRNMLANKDANICICHYFPDMVREAIWEARKTLKSMGDVASSMRETVEGIVA